MLVRQGWSLLCALAAVSSAATTQQPLVPGTNYGAPGQNASYDYVIVGGGTAGLAIAYRLAEDGSKSVAVIEAGGFYEQENGNTSVVPAYNILYDYITEDSQWDWPSVDWGFLTVPQTISGGVRWHYGRGKMLGGCSAHNALNYNLPTKGMLQSWANAVNDSSYSYDNFAPYFRRSVNYTNPNTSLRAANATLPAIDASYAGVGGPLKVAHPNWATPLGSWAQLAFREMGIQDTHDQISGELIGSQYNPITMDPEQQIRWSSQTAFLDAALASGRKNLHVYIHSMAKQVVFDANKTARAVKVQTGLSPQAFYLSANKEVIVSAGAFQSPQLLMVSGVGPSQTLTSHNITVVADRPGVGQNMWDHTVVSIGRQVNVETWGRLMNQTLATQAETEYNLNRTGILTNVLADYLGFEKLPNASRSALSASALSNLSQFPSDWPEIEYEVSSGPFGNPDFSSPENPFDVGWVQPVLVSPLSRGNVSISSPDMADPPLINPNLMSHPTDREVAVAAFKRGRQFFNTTAIKPILIGEELFPAQALPNNATDDQILEFLLPNIGFNWHASCTCKMGMRSDPMAVVDSTAKVIGVNGLRVVDASAFPMLPPGHPQATVYALAEKIAADILAGR